MLLGKPKATARLPVMQVLSVHYDSGALPGWKEGLSTSSYVVTHFPSYYHNSMSVATRDYGASHVLNVANRAGILGTVVVGDTRTPWVY
jgi:hypothetical protein